MLMISCSSPTPQVGPLSVPYEPESKLLKGSCIGDYYRGYSGRYYEFRLYSSHHSFKVPIFGVEEASSAG